MKIFITTRINNKDEMDRLRSFCLVFWLIFQLDYSTISVSAIHQGWSFSTALGVTSSVGAEAFADTTGQSMGQCVYYTYPRNALYTLEQYPVFYNDEPLFGWFNLKISNSGGPNMRWTFAQAQTISPSGEKLILVPGEFLFTQFDADNAPTCVTKKEGGADIEIQKKHYAPGFYATDPNPTLPVGFSYVNSNASGVGPTSMTLNWRMNFPPCAVFGKQRALHFHMYIISEAGTTTCENQYVKNRNIFFQEYASGAHDPDPPKNAQLNCSKSLAELEKDNNLPQWIEKLGPLDIKTDAEYLLYGYCFYNIFDLGQDVYKTQKFFGRCVYKPSLGGEYKPKFKVGYNVTSSCDSDNDFWIKLPEQGVIIDDNTRNGTCKECKEIEDKINGGMGISADSAIGKRVFSYRRGHGLFMIIGTVFFMTVSHFGAHFYKETFFNKRIINFHVWYTIHVNGSVMALLCFFAGMFAGISARLFLGFSELTSSKIHVIFGWISIAVFGLVFLSNGIRFRSPKPRIVSIVLHYLGGGFSYLLCLVCLASSCYIPASPSARNDIHRSGKFEYHFLVPLIAWIVFDLVISIVMNICMLSNDKRMEFKKKRKWAPFAVCGVAIPMLRPYSKKDLEGAKLRKLLLVVYFLVATALTIALVVMEMTSPTARRYFGPMTIKPDRVEVYPDDVNAD